MPKTRFGLEVVRRPIADGQTPLAFRTKGEAMRYLAERIGRDVIENAPHVRE